MANPYSFLSSWVGGWAGWGIFIVQGLEDLASEFKRIAFRVRYLLLLKGACLLLLLY
jgi:hypothetical protein